MVCTSPPYWGLRDYGLPPLIWGGDPQCPHEWAEETIEREMRRGVNLAASPVSTRGGAKKIAEVGWQRFTRGSCLKCGAWRGALGLEPTPEFYVQHLVEIFREVGRVLRDDGTCWINMGDSYASGDRSTYRSGASDNKGHLVQNDQSRPRTPPGLKPKDLCGIPWRVAFALQQPHRVPTCVQSEVDRAWLAAMFDGEGTIGIRRFDSYRKEKQQVYQDGFIVYTSVTNSDVELLDRCIELTGFGDRRIKWAGRAGETDKRGITTRRDSYGWRQDGNNAVRIIRAIYPYLIAKKKQACIAYTLDYLNKHGHGSRSVPKEIQEKKVYLWGLIKGCNQRKPVDVPSWLLEPQDEFEPGWYLRSDIIWSKPNPMPESVTDRPTKAHEYLFLLAKSDRYFYDAFAIQEQCESGPSDVKKMLESLPRIGGKHKTLEDPLSKASATTNIGRKRSVGNPNGRNRRSVWTIATEPYPEAHFATFPEKLVEPCILAGTSARGACAKCGAPWARVIQREVLPPPDRIHNNPFKHDAMTTHGEGGATLRNVVSKETAGWRPTCACGADPVPCIVFDPFVGSGTTVAVAESLGRRGIGLELKAEYLALAKKRIADVLRGLPI